MLREPIPSTLQHFPPCSPAFPDYIAISEFVSIIYLLLCNKQSQIYSIEITAIISQFLWVKIPGIA